MTLLARIGGVVIGLGALALGVWFLLRMPVWLFLVVFWLVLAALVASIVLTIPISSEFLIAAVLAVFALITLAEIAESRDREIAPWRFP